MTRTVPGKVRTAAAFCVALLCASVAHAADYAAMAPVDQYMMDRSAEIALANGAAPSSISDKATVLVLTPHGYDTAVKGSNRFVCTVERAGMSQYDFPQCRSLSYFFSASALLSPSG